MMSSRVNLFNKEVAYLILHYIYKKGELNLSSIMRYADVSSSYTQRVLKYLQKKGILNVVKMKNKRITVYAIHPDYKKYAASISRWVELSKEG